MAIAIPRGTSDPVIDQMVSALTAYQADHPQAHIDLYRRNPVSVRLRIIDPGFAGKSKLERSEHVWKYFDALPDMVVGDISVVLLLSPEEMKTSFANVEFDDPAPSML
jgi:hypothetical protein